MPSPPPAENPELSASDEPTGNLKQTERGFSGGREADGEPRATQGGAGAADGAAVVLDHGAHDGEAETDAAGRAVAGLVESGEAVEDPLLGVDRHAGPIV